MPLVVCFEFNLFEILGWWTMQDFVTIEWRQTNKLHAFVFLCDWSRKHLDFPESDILSVAGDTPWSQRWRALFI